MASSVTMEKIVSLCKRRGFIFPGSEIYGGLANTWDYGPYGVELKNNVKKLWWKYFVQNREDMVGLDASILMNPRVWEASGHITSFSDPLMDCKKCHERVRGDKILEEITGEDFYSFKDRYLIDLYQQVIVINEEYNKKLRIEVAEKKEKLLIMQSKLAHVETLFAELGLDITSKLDSFSPKSEIKRELGVDLTLAVIVEMEDFLNKIKKNDLKFLSYIFKMHAIPCPKCKSCDWTEARSFNLMFKTYQGVIEEEAAMVYMRPETAQGIFVNFKNVQQTTRKKLPFGIGQIGKAFRNEITPGNFIFRTREFEQMEIEYFIKEKEWKPIYDSWRETMEEFFTKELGFKKDSMRWRQHDAKELSHYSKETWDVEYKFPFGWGELWGIAFRTDFDLKQHEKFSGEKMEYLDPETNEKFVPHCIEPTFGVDRTVLVALLEAYDEDQAPSEKPGKEVEQRIVMRLPAKLAPIKAAILPLMKKDPLGPKAKKMFDDLKKHFMVEYDESGTIGKRYRRHDELGTPFCFTIDFQTIEDDTVTVRDRDSMKQERIKIAEVKNFLQDKLEQ